MNIRNLRPAFFIKLLPVSLLFCAQLSFSQVYEPLVRDNAHWVVETYNSELIWGYEDFREYFTDGDTVFNDTVYKRVYRYHLAPDVWPTTPPYHRVGGPDLFGFLREDTAQRKVYGIRSIINYGDCFFGTEGLLFDYSVNQGDTLDLCQAFLSPLVIGNVFYMNEFGYNRKHFNISFGGYLVEGIGSSYGLFEEIGYTFKNSKGSRYVLLCYTIGDISDCNITTGINQLNENKAEIYPNPLQGKILYVKLPEGGHRDWQADISDLYGRVLLHVQLEYSVEQLHLPDLAPGIYTIKVYNRQQVFSVEKILKI